MLKESSSVRIVGPIIFDAFGLFTKEIYDQLLIGDDTIIDDLLFKHLSGEDNERSKISEQVQKRS
jgi:hypothetical protein